MSKTTKKDADRAEAQRELRKLLKPGAEVWTILRHVSSSGMFRVIDLVIPYVKDWDDHLPMDAEPSFPAKAYRKEGERAYHTGTFGGVAPDGTLRIDFGGDEAPLYAPRDQVQLIKVRRKPALRSIGWLAARAMGDTFDSDRQGLKVGGCGMDMGFHVVYGLGRTLYPKGVKKGYAGRPEGDGGYAFKHTWL